MKHPCITTLIAIGAALSVSAQVTETAPRVSGKVLDAGGKPVSGIRLMLTIRELAPNQANPGVVNALSADDGTYSLREVPDGDYNLCAADDARRYLDTCVWSEPIRLSLAEGKSLTNIEVRVEEAAEVTVEISDPGQRLVAAEGPQPVSGLLVGVAAPRAFVPASKAEATTETPTLQNRKLYVPYDRDVEISVISNDLPLTDGAGRALKPGGDKLALRVPRGQKQTTVAVVIEAPADQR